MYRIRYSGPRHPQKTTQRLTVGRTVGRGLVARRRRRRLGPSFLRSDDCVKVDDRSLSLARSLSPSLSRLGVTAPAVSQSGIDRPHSAEDRRTHARTAAVVNCTTHVVLDSIELGRVLDSTEYQ